MNVPLVTEPAADQGRAPSARRGVGKVEESRRLQALFVTAARLLAALFSISIPIVLVRVLDQNVFGYYKQLFLLAQTSLAVLTVGLPASLYYFVPRYPRARQRFLVQSAGLLGVLGIAAGAAFFAAGPLLERFFHAPLGPFVPWIALFVTFSVPASLLYVAPMVERRALLAALLLAGSETLRAGLLVAIALWTRDLTSILIVATAHVGLQVLVVAAYIVWRSHADDWRPGLKSLRQQLAYALPFAGASVIGLFRDSLHLYYVAASFSAAQFAIYAVATLNIPFIGHLTTTVGEVLILENSGNFAADRREEMQRIWHRAAYILALILIPIFTITEVFAGDIIFVLFGSAYMEATLIFRVYLVVMPLSILLASPMLRATGDLKVLLIADIVSLVVAVGVLLLVASRFGPLGAVLSVVAGQTVFVLVASRRIVQRLHLRVRIFLPWRRIFHMMLLGISSGFASSLIVHSLAPVPRLFIGGALAAVVFGLLAWVAGLIPPPELELLIRVAKSFRRSARDNRPTVSRENV